MSEAEGYTLFRFGKFAAVGGLGFAVDAGVLGVCIYGLGFGPFTGRACSIAAANVTTWLMNRSLTFRTGNAPSFREFLSYGAAKAVGLVLNFTLYAGLVAVLPAELPAKPLLALAIASVGAMMLNYFLLERFVFAAAKATHSQ